MHGSAGPDALCLIFANSRTLWEPFLEACAASDDSQLPLLEQDNPLEAYLQRHVCASLAACAPGMRHRLYWSHAPPAGGLDGGGDHIAFQRMAHHCGLAFLDEVCRGWRGRRAGMAVFILYGLAGYLPVPAPALWQLVLAARRRRV